MCVCVNVYVCVSMGGRERGGGERNRVVRDINARVSSIYRSKTASVASNQN